MIDHMDAAATAMQSMPTPWSLIATVGALAVAALPGAVAVTTDVNLMDAAALVAALGVPLVGFAIRGITRSVDDVKSNQVRSDERLRSIELRMADRDHDHAEKLGAVEQLKEKIGDLNSENLSLRDRVGELKSENQQLRDRVCDLKTDLKDCQSRLAALERRASDA